MTINSNGRNPICSNMIEPHYDPSISHPGAHSAWKLQKTMTGSLALEDISGEAWRQ